MYLYNVGIDYRYTKWEIQGIFQTHKIFYKTCTIIVYKLYNVCARSFKQIRNYTFRLVLWEKIDIPFSFDNPIYFRQICFGRFRKLCMLQANLFVVFRLLFVYTVFWSNKAFEICIKDEYAFELFKDRNKVDLPFSY